MKKKELIEKIKERKEFYEVRNEMAKEKECPGLVNVQEYADWWYEVAVRTFTDMIIRDLQELIDVIEAPF